MAQEHPEQPLFTNQLLGEKSPYLISHVHDPVNWYPWAEEAFRLAKDQDKPIFLSIGYASCHWCHVMDSESFANLEIARLMNETFINIKVDREEKPEVDGLYMEFAQAMMSGGAGWPLNLMLTADLMPFFAVTYLPPDAKHGFLGLKQLIKRIQEIWQDPEERDAVALQAGHILNLFESHVHAEGSVLPSKELISECAELLFKTADPLWGGVRGAPKFPMGHHISFLLRFSKKTADSRALFHVEQTLDMMCRGGIFDQIGGGFARYSIDERWQVPHFEKMLYDNAILARAYLEAWQFTHVDVYADITRSLLNYMERDLKAPQGAFYSAEDADTEGSEGQYYLWSWQEIHQILQEDAQLFCAFYGVTPTGNFEGSNVLHRPYTLQEFSQQHRIDSILLETKLNSAKEKLFAERAKRTLPKKDKKIVTAWNGLAIYTFAEASRALNNEHYLQVASQTARFLRDHLWTTEEMLRRYCDGEAKFSGCLEDYAFFISGLISLFEADGGVEWLELAIDLTNVLVKDFKAPHGAFYVSNGADPHLILRRCEFFDGAEPSGNAVQTENFIRLFQLTGAKDYLVAAEDVLKAAKQHVELYPPGGIYHLMALMRYLDPFPVIVVALNDEETYHDEIRHLLASRFMPHLAVVWRRDSDEELRDISIVARDKKPVSGKTALYICHRDSCQVPLTDIDAMARAIEQI